MASIAEVAATMRDVVTPGMKPKEIRAAIREKHPEASKKEIVRAAFYALAEAPAGALADLHGFALSERGADEEADTVVRARKRKRKKHAPAAAEVAPAA
ncbi:hypothetical protein AFCDBAGC_2452 [Methylobacterium cerastii]|uniref:Uncharacterized protein n=1 Tax=Methylobacterium cerastii TaxID=932741 RepID=A0ABQ4QI84_9HYPH|nr:MULTISPECIES: hypothetical protein [Methylobacterium]TXN78533.1 hypothetical protein FV234_22550 [Methylobacterium sp. WL8]GJD44585.1 hypothetical protein AFCDBAGC_2452 [Methylobacterium cerastii]